MLKIGLTGGIASGKSTVLNYFKEKGVPYIDADVIAREVTEPGSPGLAALADCFGESVLHDDGTLNREALGALVFHDEGQRQRLNDCIHPFIRRRIKELTDTYEADGTKILIYDIPLLIEGNWQRELDTVWLVYVNPRCQLERLKARNGYSEEDALARIQSQMSMDDKRSYADVIIDNNGSYEELYAQLDALWQSIN